MAGVRGQAVVALVSICWSCEPDVRLRPAQWPIASIEIAGNEAFVYLVEGVGGRAIVGCDIFGPLNPGVTPDQATSALGPPTRTEDEGPDTVTYYEATPPRVAVVTRRIAPSGGGPRMTSYELRAAPPGDFAVVASLTA